MMVKVTSQLVHVPFCQPPVASYQLQLDHPKDWNFPSRSLESQIAIEQAQKLQTTFSKHVSMLNTIEGRIPQFEGKLWCNTTPVIHDLVIGTTKTLPQKLQHGAVR